ncbi:TetR family transcriptional regulator [Nocardia sp. AG03]|uniref:TetR/AcrR family transcriptional regulator n=1 Tax=Nocardia sp. AG03 TaxID=3025312 RepID=UPI0024185ADF|nr:TetR family transcriptional regulator [Nocardia sp. AG03]
MPTAPRRRDPERRRREIIDAAVAIVLEEGSGAVTHRKVAARAEVPLGSTTQYFATLDDLRAAALDRLVREIDVWLDALVAAFDRDGATPATFAAQLHLYLSDTHLIEATHALTSSYLTPDEEHAASRQWTIRFIEMLERYTSPAAARAVAAMSDGLTLHAAVLTETPDLDALTRAVTALWNLETA